jgi:hypothetical protein
VPKRSENTYESQCLGKEVFQTGQLAWHVAIRRARAGIVSEAYRCKVCRQYHVGTPTKTKFKRKRRL